MNETDVLKTFKTAVETNDLWPLLELFKRARAKLEFKAKYGNITIEQIRSKLVIFGHAKFKLSDAECLRRWNEIYKDLEDTAGLDL
jgi:hypothetical protein